MEETALEKARKAIDERRKAIGIEKPDGNYQVFATPSNAPAKAYIAGPVTMTKGIVPMAYVPQAAVRAAATNKLLANNEHIKARIIELRTKKGWTQRDLAKQSGMSQGTVTRAERHMAISLWCLFRIAYALGMKVDLISSTVA